MQDKIAVVNSTDFIKLIMTHKLMKKHDVEAVAAARAARMQVAALTTNVYQCTYVTVTCICAGRAVVVQQDALPLLMKKVRDSVDSTVSFGLKPKYLCSNSR